MKVIVTTIFFLGFAAGLGCGQTLQYAGQAAHFEAGPGRMPIWSGGRLIYVQNDDSATPTVRMIRPDATEETPFTFSIPGANVTRIAGTAFEADGTLILCGTSYDKTGRGGGYLAIVPANRGNVTVTRVSPFMPTLVASSGDGNIWVQGSVGKGGSQTDGAIRRYDKAGKQVGQYLPVNGFSPVDFENNNRLSAGVGRVGWYARSVPAYFEISSDGSVQRFPVPRSGDQVWATGLALTDSGETVVGMASAYEQDLGLPRIYTLNKTISAWTPINMPADLKITDFAYLYGGDGGRLAALILNRPAITFFSFAK